MVDCRVELQSAVEGWHTKRADPPIGALINKIKNFEIDNISKYFLDDLFYDACNLIYRFYFNGDKSPEIGKEYLKKQAAAHIARIEHYLTHNTKKDIPRAFFYFGDAISEDYFIKKEYDDEYVENIKNRFFGLLDQNNINKNTIIKFKKEMPLVYSSQNKKKACHIPDSRCSPNSGFEYAKKNKSQHEWLSVLEYKVRSTWQGHSYNNHENYIVGNLGFVYSKEPVYPNGRTGEKNTQSERCFYSIPIAVDNPKVFYHPGGVNKHSEDGLFKFLKAHLFSLMKTWFEKVGIMDDDDPPINGHKIYAMIIDVHSTNDMCSPCSKNLNQYLEDLRYELVSCVTTDFPNEYHLNVELKQKNDISVIIRFTSSKSIDQSLLKESEKPGEYDAMHIQSAAPLTITHQDRNVLLHGSKHLNAEGGAPLPRHVFHSNLALQHTSRAEGAQSFKLADGTWLKNANMGDFSKIFSKPPKIS